MPPAKSPSAPRQRLAPRHLESVTGYLWRRGFLDGWESYYFARLHGFYEFLSVAKSYELKKQRRSA